MVCALAIDARSSYDNTPRYEHVSPILYDLHCRLVPSRYLNFNFIGTNRYISISIYIDQYQRWTRARGKGKAREKITTGRLQRQNGGQFYNKT